MTMITRLLAALLLVLLAAPTSAQLRQKRYLGLIKSIPKLSSARASKALTKALASIKAVKATDEFSDFDPSTDDPDWPGEFPSSGSDEDLVINIRLDSYPKELYLNVYKAFPKPEEDEDEDEEDVSFSRIFKARPGYGSKQKQGDGEPEIWSVAIDYLTDTDSLYEVELVDRQGDGICCGPSGLGWITVTDRDESVLWSSRGDFRHVTGAYFWKDALGNFEMVGSISSSPTDGVVSASESESSGSGGCSLCSEQTNSGSPDKLWVYEDTKLTCADMEEAYESFTSDDCQESEEDGSTAYFRAFCNCPGYEPICPLCDGDQVANPDKELENEDPDEEDATCGQFEGYFMTLPDSECEEWDSDNVDTIEDLCGCT